MHSNDRQNTIDFTVNRNNLYREESFTDVRVAAIRRLAPVKPDGSEDDSRDPIFMGQSQLMTPSGPIMLQSLLDAKTFEESMEKFPAAMQKEMARVLAEVKEKQ
jgi:hypothetical protein